MSRSTSFLLASFQNKETQSVTPSAQGLVRVRTVPVTFRSREGRPSLAAPHTDPCERNYRTPDLSKFDFSNELGGTDRVQCRLGGQTKSLPNQDIVVTPCVSETPKC
jgi:hypothetical protein